jgi:hypothetical protein
MAKGLQEQGNVGFAKTRQTAKQFRLDSSRNTRKRDV